MPLPMTRKSARTCIPRCYSGCYPINPLGVELAGDPVRVDVTAGTRTSAIWIGNGVTDRAAELLAAHHAGAKRFIVSSPVIWRFHGERLLRALGGADPILIPDGERYKNLQS